MIQRNALMQNFCIAYRGILSKHELVLPVQLEDLVSKR